MIPRYYNFLRESSYEDLDYIVEQQNGDAPKCHYLTGPFMMAGSPNKNKRIYDIDEMITESERYTTEYVKTGRALGELNHPIGEGCTEINLEKAAHMVVNLERKDNLIFGKTKILSTPTGVITRQLLSDGVKIGISSRALGKLIPENGFNKVKGLKLICLDLVHEPSAPAMLESIMESKQFLIEEGGKIVEIALEGVEKRISNLPRKDVDDYLKETFIKFFDSLKK